MQMFAANKSWLERDVLRSVWKSKFDENGSMMWLCGRKEDAVYEGTLHLHTQRTFHLEISLGNTLQQHIISPTLLFLSLPPSSLALPFRGSYLILCIKKCLRFLAVEYFMPFNFFLLLRVTLTVILCLSRLPPIPQTHHEITFRFIHTFHSAGNL